MIIQNRNQYQYVVVTERHARLNAIAQVYGRGTVWLPDTDTAEQDNFEADMEMMGVKAASPRL